MAIQRITEPGEQGAYCGRAQPESIVDCAREVMNKEARAVAETAGFLGEAFTGAVNAILQCRRRVCVTGIGKAGIIGRKIRGTLASTGTPSYSLHPIEALHGDLGTVNRDDVVIALSKSGGSEVAQLIPLLRAMGCRIIVITAEPNSPAAAHADYVLLISSGPEACPLGLAPSSSTTAMLALGDALALTVMKQKAFRPEQYALNHPGGALGRALMKVRDIMRRDANCPRVSADATLAQCYEAMLGAPLRAGAAIVVDGRGALAGILTQGDFFRLIARGTLPSSDKVTEYMTKSPKRIAAEAPVMEALSVMREYSIDELPVVDDHELVCGLLDIQDLIRHGFPIADAVG